MPRRSRRPGPSASARQGALAVSLSLACLAGPLAGAAGGAARRPATAAAVNVIDNGVFWVDASAAEGGDGSPSRPLRSPQLALDHAGPGSVIFLAPGDYPGKLHSVRSGTATAPIQLVGKIGPNGRRARLHHDGTSRLLEINHDHIWIADLELSDANILVTAIGTHGVAIVRNVLHDAGSECVRLRANAAGNEVGSNVIRRCGLTGFSGSQRNGEGIYIGTALDRLGDNPTPGPDRSTGNWIHGNDIAVIGECVDIKEDADGNAVNYNSCVGNRYEDSAGIATRARGTFIWRNVSTGHLGSGVMIAGDRQGDGTASVVEGNTLSGNGQYGLKVVSGGAQALLCNNNLTGNGRGPTTPGEERAGGAC